MVTRRFVLCSAGTSVAVPDPGSGAFFTPWIRDPGWSNGRIRIRDPG
jgi:hypothetical protein